MPPPRWANGEQTPEAGADPGGRRTKDKPETGVRPAPGAEDRDAHSQLQSASPRPASVQGPAPEGRRPARQRGPGVCRARSP